MDKNFDHFDTKIQPEEIPQVLTTEEIDEMADLDPYNSGFSCGFAGGKEGDMPVDCSNPQVWFNGFSDGNREERENWQGTNSYEKLIKSIYGD